MKIIKLIITEETMLGNGKDDPYRRLKDIHSIDGKLLFSFDPIDKDIDAMIKEMFR